MSCYTLWGRADWISYVVFFLMLLSAPSVGRRIYASEFRDAGMATAVLLFYLGLTSGWAHFAWQTAQIRWAAKPIVRFEGVLSLRGGEDRALCAGEKCLLLAGNQGRSNSFVPYDATLKVAQVLGSKREAPIFVRMTMHGPYLFEIKRCAPQRAP